MKTTVFKKGLQTFALVASCLLLLASAASLMPFSVFLTDIPSHFPVYIMMAAVLGSLGVLVLRLNLFIVMPAMAAAGIAFIQIYPFLPLSSPITARAPTFKLLQINVYTDNHNTAPLTSLIAVENPDIVVIAELNQAFTDMGEDMSSRYPHRHYAARTAVLSRIPLEKINLTADEGVLTRPQFFRAHFAGRDFTLATFHAAAPPIGFALRDRQFAEFATLVKDLRASNRMHGPLVFAGDINVTPYAPALKNLSAALQVQNARTGKGMLHSWPVWLPEPLRIPIDHVLVSRDVHVADYRLGPDVASDHLPTIAVLEMSAP